MLIVFKTDNHPALTLRQLLRQTKSIARIDLGFFLRRAKFVASIAAIALIPALYSVIYLSSLWDPASHSQALTVGIVNLDQGFDYKDSHFNVGQELSQTLQKAARFNYRLMPHADAARQQVRQGQLAFALIIPANFSANAVPGEQAGAGQLVVFASQGNSVETARIAQQFAVELGHKVNASLNAQRWSLVLLNAAGSQQSVSQLNQGLKDLHQGATELSAAASNAATGAIAIQTGAQQLNDNVVQLTQSAKTLGAGLRQMENNRPRSADLRRLDTGADALANGVGELGQGLQQLGNGSRALSTQVSQFKEESDSSFLISATDKNNVTQAAQGLQQLDQGLHTAVENGQKLEDGAKSLRAGVNTLTAGVRGMNNALRTVVGQLPQDTQWDALNSGTTELALGTRQMAQGAEKLSSASKRLQMGLALAENAIPDMGESPEGSPEGLADSVRPVLEMDATVQNNGIGFIANVIPAALWLGAGIAAFVVNLRSLPKQAKTFHPLAQWLGKLLLPAGLVVLQCLLVLFTVFVVLQVNVVNPWALTCTILSAGLAFLCVISALTCFMGDAGKAMAMVLLALQMTSSGGVMPVELSGSFFATLSPWLPITWLAHGLKASLFGAYEGAWLLDWAQVSCVGLSAAAFTVVWGRWRYVPVRQLKPQLDL